MVFLLSPEQAALSKGVNKAQERFDEACRTLERKDFFLDSLLKTEAPPRKDPPNIRIRRLAKPDKSLDPFPQCDVESVSILYGIPTAHEVAWKAIVEPLVPFASTGSIQERVNTLFVITSLAFSVLKKIGASSGWYWLAQDLINCTQVHVMMLKEDALRGNHRRRVIQARLTHLELICKRTLWIGLRSLPTDDEATVAPKLQLLQAQMETEQAKVREDCTEGGLPYLEYHSMAVLLDERMTKATRFVNKEASVNWQEQERAQCLMW
jgi:hypothetical protein